MGLSAFDFFPDSRRAAVATFDGDVWIVSGISGTLSEITWKRYATGLFQPLGVRIVRGSMYVLGRDQITRLHDLNGDAEADFPDMKPVHMLRIRCRILAADRSRVSLDMYLTIDKLAD